MFFFFFFVAHQTCYITYFISTTTAGLLLRDVFFSICEEFQFRPKKYFYPKQ